MIKKYLQYAVAAAFGVTAGISNVAAQVTDTEPNNTVDKAQSLTIGADGTVVVFGAIGSTTDSSPIVEDIDFYKFHGTANNTVDINIDRGMKSNSAGVVTCPSAGERCVDTKLVLYGPPPTYAVIDVIDNVLATQVDRPGSVSQRDARLIQTLPVTGTYTVGVATTGRNFNFGGAVSPFVAVSSSNGSYKLIISGVTPSVRQMNIEIKPGATTIAPLNPKSKGNIPVALLSSRDDAGRVDFDALLVDRNSITFGSTGNEKSLLRCGKEGEDVNRDGLLDLVCHFDNQAASFDADDERGEIKGTIGGMPFEGRAQLKIVPKPKDKD